METTRKSELEIITLADDIYQSTLRTDKRLIRRPTVTPSEAIEAAIIHLEGSVFCGPLERDVKYLLKQWDIF